MPNIPKGKRKNQKNVKISFMRKRGFIFLITEINKTITKYSAINKRYLYIGLLAAICPNKQIIKSGREK